MAFKVNRERKMIPEREHFFEIGGTLSDMQATLQAMIERYGPDAYIEGETEPYSDSDRESFYVFTKRPENDREYYKRVKEEERMAAIFEKRERDEFERLQAKFGAK